MTWLVTGATGLLGSNATVQLSQQHHVIGAARTIPSNVPVGFEAVDLSAAASREGLIERTSATVVLHAAAISSIEECERDPELAREVNVAASVDLAAQAAAAGAAFVYISTDAVFDGKRGAYTEVDKPTPTTEYGRSKFAGECAVLEENPAALVARVNFVGWSPNGRRSLAEFFHTKLSRGEKVPGFIDVVVSTLYVGHLVGLIEQLVAAQASGVVNVVSSESTSKYEFGRRLASAFGLDKDLVRSARSTDHLSIARGSRLDLSTERMSALLGKDAPNQQMSMDSLVSDYSAGRVQSVASFQTR